IPHPTPLLSNGYNESLSTVRLKGQSLEAMEPHQYFAIPLFWIFIVALRRRDDAQIFSRAQALSGLLVLSFLPALPPLFAAQHFRCVAVYSRRAPIPAALRSSLELDLWLAPVRTLH